MKCYSRTIFGIIETDLIFLVINCVFLIANRMMIVLNLVKDLKDFLVWLMGHARWNAHLIFIVMMVKYVLVMEVVNILVRRKTTAHLVSIVIWIIRFAMTFVLLISLVQEDTNVPMVAVTNNAALIRNVQISNIVQSKFYFR